MNGDTVRVLTSKTQKPNKDWLEIVKNPQDLIFEYISAYCAISIPGVGGTVERKVLMSGA